MKNWYIYYRLLHAVKDDGTTGIARGHLQDVLVYLRGKAVEELPNTSAQEIQEFFEHLARKAKPLSQLEVMQTWIDSLSQEIKLLAKC